MGMTGFQIQAEAAPTLSLRVFEDGVAVPSLTATSDTGVLSLAGGTTYFSFVSGFASGSPANPVPTMTGQTNQISSNTNFSGTHTLRLEFTQTDLPSISAGGLTAQLANTLTANLLAAQGMVSEVTISNYASASNIAFDISDILLATATFTSPADATSVINSDLSLPNELFAMTMVIEATFTGGGATLSASSQIVAVPEPASIALFSTGLLGLGMLARTRRRNS
ncbi:PEP-CTERM sorting domain-containing protein [Roseomonas marmotae]|uniref:PEP-CTERM sorting domain-containing protein n=2 Tax=Roseomonas marmotae TaxID=2768161 RepID=A0ABS3K887_9PROT|nr:PEP-CTERM sorting domain-containing protein [Roseomonas marmotae]QTI80986.1 PEP-CTERM sorting domain-containing protein [Roseomonas marmotae]